MNRIVTPLCTLEPQSVAHAAEMFSVLSDMAIYEFENAPPVSEEWLARRYERLESRGPNPGRECWLNWVIRLPGGELCGYVQATLLSDGAAYVAYELASRFWRRGIGSNALCAMLDELQTSYQVRQFIAVLKTANFRSMALLRKTGFVEAGEEQSAVHRDEPNETVMLKWAKE